MFTGHKVVKITGLTYSQLRLLVANGNLEKPQRAYRRRRCVRGDPERAQHPCAVYSVDFRHREVDRGVRVLVLARGQLRTAGVEDASPALSTPAFRPGNGGPRPLQQGRRRAPLRAARARPVGGWSWGLIVAGDVGVAAVMAVEVAGNPPVAVDDEPEVSLGLVAPLVLQDAVSSVFLGRLGVLHPVAAGILGGVAGLRVWLWVVQLASLIQQ